MNTQRTSALISDGMSGTHRSRAGWIRIAIACGILLTVAAVAAIWLGIRQAQREAAYELLAAEARPLLQRSRNEDALEVLSRMDGSSAPPENRYLKAISLDRLQRHEAAIAEIRLAIETAPENPKYKGYELKMRLFARDRDSFDQLIELNREFASIGAVALFSTYGFQAKAVLLQAENKPEAATYHQQRQQQTLSTALTLSKEIPELYPELLQFTIRENRHEDSLRLIDELLTLEPDHLELRNEKVRVLIALKRIDDAVKLADVLYAETGSTKEGAEYLASIAAQTSDKPEHKQRLRRLSELYPSSTQISSRYAVYLTRTGHLAEAQAMLAESIEKQNDAKDKEALAFAAITLPLEVNAPDNSEEMLRKYRLHLKDPLLVDYFEARILYLRKRHADAVQRMLKIVEAAKSDGGGSRQLAAEALNWVRTILADKVIAEQMQLVIDASRKSAAAPRIDVRVAEDEPASEQKATPADKAAPAGQTTLKPRPAPQKTPVSTASDRPLETDPPAGSVEKP